MYGESDQDNSLMNKMDTALAQAMAEYEQLVKEGHPFSREAFLAKHNAIADRLASCLEAVDFLYRILPEPSTNQWPDPYLQRPDAIVGDFRIVRPIGRGGMGQVYEAHQISLNRRVALKFLRGVSALDDRAIQRFRNEALVAATLLHPNIVPVYSVGDFDHVPYIAMQLIDGFSLADVMAFLRGEQDLSSEGERLQQAVASLSATSSTSSSKVKFLADLSAVRRQPRVYFQKVVGWILQAANGLSHAHDAGIVHRDIKPENVLVDGDENIWIADFGLAKLPESNLTETADLLGTLRYMSPEQAAGKGFLLDGRTDVYSLGATLYELLTLCPIFIADDRSSLLHKVLHDEPRSPRQIEKDLPLELEIILQKAMAKDAHERYATAADFAADLERYLSDRPILASPTSRWRRVEKWIKRNRVAVGVTVVTLAFCMTVGLFALSIGLFLLRDQRDQLGLALKREGNALRSANRANQFAMKSLASERKARTIEKQVAYRQTIALAHSLWKSGKVENAKEILQDCPEGLRGWEWGFVLQLCRRECNSIAMALESPRQLECTAQGEVMVLGTDGAKKWSIPSGELLETWKVPSDPNSVIQLVPGGERWIRYPRKRTQEPNELQWFEGLSGNLLRAIPLRGTISNLSMSADGETWATVSSDGYRIGKTLSSTNDRDVRHVLSGRIAFSRDGSLYATKATEGRDRKWFELANVDSHLGIAWTEQGEFITKIDDIMIAGTDLDLLVFSPDNRYLASSIFQGGIKVWEVASGKLHCKLDARLGDQGDMAFAPDGRWLATSDHTDDVIRIWDVQKGQPIKQFAAGGSRVKKIHFSGDGSILVAMLNDHSLQFWDLTLSAEGERVASVARHSLEGGIWGLPPCSVTLSPSGRWAALFYGDHTVVIDSTTWKTVHKLSLPAPKDASRVHASVYSVQFDEPQGLIYQMTNSGILHWSLETGKLLDAIPIPFDFEKKRLPPSDRQVERSSAISNWSAWDWDFTPQSAILTHHAQFLCVDVRSARSRAAGDPQRYWFSVRNSKDGSLVQEVFGSLDSDVYCLARSNDGRRFAAASYVGDWVFHWNDLAQRESWRHGIQHQVRRMRYSDKGDRLAIADAGGTVSILDTETGEELQSFACPIQSRIDLVFSPDGRRLAIGIGEPFAGPGEIRLYDVESEFPLLEIGTEHAPESLNFAPDGRQLWFTDCTGKLWRLDSVERSYKKKVEGHRSRLDAWHREAIDAMASEGDAFGRLHHLDQLLRIHPNDEELIAERVAARLEKDGISAIDSDWLEKFEQSLTSSSLKAAYRLSAAYLKSGNLESHQRLCQHLRRQLHEGLSTREVYAIGQLCLTAPITEGDGPILIDECRRSLSTGSPESEHLLDCLQGMASFRSGEHDAARRYLLRGTRSDVSTPFAPIVWLFEAMNQSKRSSSSESVWGAYRQAEAHFLDDQDRRQNGGTAPWVDFHYPLIRDEFRRSMEKN